MGPIKVAVVMRPSRFQDLFKQGFFGPDHSQERRQNNEISFCIVDPTQPYPDHESYDLLLHKVRPT